MKRYGWFLLIAGLVVGFAFSLRALAVPVQTPPAALQGGTINGQVLLPSGAPLAGVRVGVVPTAGSGQNLIAQTDREGRYRLTNIPPGGYFLVVDPAEAAVYFPGVTDRAAATVVTVAAGATIADRTIRLKSPLVMRVSGRVIRDGHQAGNQVVLQGNALGALTAAIGPDDTFEFTNVRPGTYQLRVNPNIGATPIAVVVSDKDVTGVEMLIPLSAVTDTSVRITAVVEGGGPMPRLQMAFVSAGAGPVNSNAPINGRNVALTGASQALQLPVGEYRLAQAPNSTPLPPGYSIKSITAGNADLLKETLKVTAAGVPLVTVTLGVASPPPWVKVKGKATDLDKALVKPDTITLTTNALVAPLTSPIKPDGSFEFPMVLPGTYQARLTPSVDTFTRTVSVGLTDLANLELPTTVPTVSVSGIVTPAPPVQGNNFFGINLRPDQPGGGQIVNVQVGLNGNFTFTGVRPGNYTLIFPGCPPEICTAPNIPVTVGDKDITNLIMALGAPAGAAAARGARGTPAPAATPARGGNVAANNGQQPPVVVSGRVSTEIGVPLPKFRLRFTSAGITRSLAVSDEVFSAQLPPGSHQVAVADLPVGYVVRSITDGALDLRSGMLRVSAAAGVIGPGTTVPRLAITLGVSSPPPWVRISGRLSGLSGAPPANTAVTFTGTVLAGVLIAPIRSDGTFEISTALPDTYAVRITPDMGMPSKTITVTTDGLANLELAAGTRTSPGEFIKVQPGEFQMGCGQPQCGDDSKPVHAVRITKAFEIGKYEVTQAEWQSVMGSNPSNFKGDARPVDYVSWGDAHEFLDKLNARRDGYRYRLPTEAEWEYAARAGADAGPADATAWYEANSNLETHPAGQKKPNAWGLHDMRGNIAEWVEDWYARYADTAAADPKGPATGREHVLRGGSWFSQPATADVHSRDRLDPAQRSDRIGFRLVREPNP